MSSKLAQKPLLVRYKASYCISRKEEENYFDQNDVNQDNQQRRNDNTFCGSLPDALSTAGGRVTVVGRDCSDDESKACRLTRGRDKVRPFESHKGSFHIELE